jgi:putative endonuclease
MFTVYVLFSKKFNKIYIGMTSNMEQRFFSHNELSTKGWTKNFRPWIIVHQELFDSKALALLREKQLKSAAARDFIREKIIRK